MRRVNSAKEDFGKRRTVKYHGVKKRLVFYVRIKSCMDAKQYELASFMISHKTGENCLPQLCSGTQRAMEALMPLDQASC